MAGIWVKSRELLRTRGNLTAREIADSIDAIPTEVNSILAMMAKQGKVVRVVTVAPGPLRWRLPDEDPQRQTKPDGVWARSRAQLNQRGALPATAIAEAIGSTPKVVSSVLSQMAKRGKVVRVDARTRGGSWQLAPAREGEQR